MRAVNGLGNTSTVFQRNRICAFARSLLVFASILVHERKGSLLKQGMTLSLSHSNSSARVVEEMRMSRKVHMLRITFFPGAGGHQT